MDKIWIINISGSLTSKYGWFDSKDECQERCDKLNEEHSNSNMRFFPHEIMKGVNNMFIKLHLKTSKNPIIVNKAKINDIMIDEAGDTIVDTESTTYTVNETIDIVEQKLKGEL